MKRFTIIALILGACLTTALVASSGVREVAEAAASVGWVVLRVVREGVNTLLPLTQVGGEFIGARLLTFYRVEGALAAASVIVDLLMQAGTQFLFTAIGLVALIWLGGDE